LNSRSFCLRGLVCALGHVNSAVAVGFGTRCMAFIAYADFLVRFRYSHPSRHGWWRQVDLPSFAFSCLNTVIVVAIAAATWGVLRVMNTAAVLCRGSS